MSIELRPDEARALAFLLNRIRPDWNIEAMMKIFGQNKMIPSLADLMIASATKAKLDIAKTPILIFTEGDHWPKPQKMKLPPMPRCEDHPTEDAPTCHCCWADVKVGDRSEDQVGKSLLPDPVPASTANASQVKQILRNYKATVNDGGFSHGVA